MENAKRNPRLGWSSDQIVGPGCRYLALDVRMLGIMVQDAVTGTVHRKARPRVLDSCFIPIEDESC